MKEVTLDYKEMMCAALVASMRQIAAVKKSHGQNYGYEMSFPESWGDAVESCCSEVALAKELNQYWRGMGSFEDRHKGDVGDGNEARWTRYANGHLIVHPEDIDDHVYYLITGWHGVYQVHGYFSGWSAKQQKWWTTEMNGKKLRNAAYFIPRGELVEYGLEEVPY